MPLYDEGRSPTQSAIGQTGYQQALNYYQGQAEPQLAYLNLQGTQAQNKLGQFYAAKDLAASQLGSGRNFANQDYGLGMERLGLQRGAVGVDTDYYHTLQNLAGNMLGLNQLDINTQYNTGVRNQMSQAIAAGAVQSKGNVSNLADLFMNKNISMGKLQGNYDAQMAGYDRQLKLNTNQLAQLDITAKELGLSREKALSSISQGLAKLNLDAVLHAGDLMDALQSNDFERQQIALQIIHAASDAAPGFPGTPGVYSGTTAGTSSTRIPRASATPGRSSKLPNTSLSPYGLTG